MKKFTINNENEEEIPLEHSIQVFISLKIWKDISARIRKSFSESKSEKIMWTERFFQRKEAKTDKLLF